MALVFHRRLAIPLWGVAFLTVAFAAPPPAMLFPMPPTTLFVVAVFGIAGILMMPGVVPLLRSSRSVVRVLPSTHRKETSAAITMTAGTCVRTLDEPNDGATDDALDLVRMDDDGGWQMARPPA